MPSKSEIEAAHAAYEKYGQVGNLKTQRLSNGCMISILTAAEKVRHRLIKVCPFSNPSFYCDPKEPCPVCGALGDDQSADELCVSAGD